MFSYFVKAVSSCFQYQMLPLNIKNLRKYFLEGKNPKPVGPNTVYAYNTFGFVYTMLMRHFGEKMGSEFLNVTELVQN